MTDQEAVRNLHEAIDDTTIFYYDARREAAHAALAALVAERDRYLGALEQIADEHHTTNKGAVARAALAVSA